ncbi:IS701 family transposase [Streptomyces sp. TRM68367]|uniref:IS701 family transposase n=1 Tax=Streptomyces sp. TRM68367 TaxID=2758415 RepID=UPI00165C906C|nr:IS701 family transposase [Streptomyces sp. TRM68367]MBC9731447.1 IS701 family transposase [Streptomyces sp. TRM68367]
MTQHQNKTTASATVDHEGHDIAFRGLLASVADCFARSETRATFARMTRGMLMELEDVNCWSLSEAIGEQGPHRLHHLLSRAVWDEEAVLQRTAAWAVDLLDDGDGILIADETGDAKSSTDAVAAARQYSGSVGGVDLCQVAVHLTFASSAGHCLIGRRLYFTQEWAGDEERRELTGVPDELCFATKPQLTAHMLRTAQQQGISASFFLGDEVYGGRELRTACRELGLGYVVGVRSNHQVTTGPVKLSVVKAAARLPKRAWQRMATGVGQKGVREYDWAMIEVTADDTPEGHDRDTGTSVLLVRRHRYTRTVSYYRCFAPGPVTLARLVSLVCRRWRVEDDFQDSKEICHLDKGQVTCWNSWHRWSVIALVAYAFLAVAAALERAAQTGRNDPAEADLVPLSSHELLRLLRALILPPPRRDPEHLLWWSTWRRRHQHHARLCHCRWHPYADTTP